MLMGKRVVNLLLVLSDFSLGVTAEELQANIDWKSAFFAPVRPKISGTRGRPPPTVFLLEN